MPAADRKGTHDVVVLAAHGARAAGRGACAHHRDRRALETDVAGHVLDGDAEDAQQRRASGGVGLRENTARQRRILAVHAHAGTVYARSQRCCSTGWGRCCICWRRQQGGGAQGRKRRRGRTSCLFCEKRVGLRARSGRVWTAKRAGELAEASRGLLETRAAEGSPLYGAGLGFTCLPVSAV